MSTVANEGGSSAAPMAQSRVQGRVSCTFPDCNKHFLNANTLKAHKAKHHRHVYCKHCDMDFLDPESLWQHKVDSDKHYTCLLCKTDYINEPAYEMHVEQRHPRDQYLQCHCGMVFKRAGGLMAHVEAGQCPKVDIGTVETIRLQKKLIAEYLANPGRFEREAAARREEEERLKAVKMRAIQESGLIDSEIVAPLDLPVLAPAQPTAPPPEDGKDLMEFSDDEFDTADEPTMDNGSSVDNGSAMDDVAVATHEATVDSVTDVDNEPLIKDGTATTNELSTINFSAQDDKAAADKEPATENVTTATNELVVDKEPAADDVVVATQELTLANVTAHNNVTAIHKPIRDDVVITISDAVTDSEAATDDVVATTHKLTIANVAALNKKAVVDKEAAIDTVATTISGAIYESEFAKSDVASTTHGLTNNDVANNAHGLTVANIIAHNNEIALGNRLAINKVATEANGLVTDSEPAVNNEAAITHELTSANIAAFNNGPAVENAASLNAVDATTKTPAADKKQAADADPATDDDDQFSELLLLSEDAVTEPRNLLDNDPEPPSLLDQDPEPKSLLDHDPEPQNVLDHDPESQSFLDRDPEPETSYQASASDGPQDLPTAAESATEGTDREIAKGFLLLDQLRNKPKEVDQKMFLHPITGRYRCPILGCKANIKTFSGLLSHARSMAHLNQRAICPSCLKEFRTTAALIQHCESPSTRCYIRKCDGYHETLDQLTGGLIGIKGNFPDGTVKYTIGKLKRPAFSNRVLW